MQYKNKLINTLEQTVQHVVKKLKNARIFDSLRMSQFPTISSWTQKNSEFETLSLYLNLNCYSYNITKYVKKSFLYLYFQFDYFI